MTQTAPRGEMADLAPDLAAALTAPTPRTGPALRAVLRAQRASWRWIYVYVILMALFGGLYAWTTTDPILQSPALWVAAVGSPFIFLFALFNYLTARRLAQHGVCAPARTKRLDDGLFALYYGDDLGLGRRRALWSSNRSPSSHSQAYMLFQPQRSAAYAWVGGVGEVAQQEPREKPPSARLRRV